MLLLLVEDDEFAARAATRLATLEGAHTLVAASAVAARVALAETQKPFDGALIDVCLPEGGDAGLVLAGEMHHADPTFPVAIVTGAADHTIANRAAACGAVTIFKPLTRHELLAFVRRASKHRSRAEPIAVRIGRRAVTMGLTPREVDIVVAIVCGQGRAEYVDRNGISMATFRTHAENIRNKTGRSVAQLAMYLAREAGNADED